MAATTACWSSTPFPRQSGAAADLVIGQIGGSVNQASDAADSLRTPMSLAWDGTNLYVSDAYNRRITVYSMGENTIPYAGVRNAASLDIMARGRVTFAGGIQAGRRDRHQHRRHADPPTVTGKVTTTGGADYKYTVSRTTPSAPSSPRWPSRSMPPTAAPATPMSMPRPIWPPATCC